MKSDPKKVILIGAGSRGRAYTDIMADYPLDFELVAVAEPLKERREYIKDKHSLKDEYCFGSWESLLALPRIADVAIISTMDRDHFLPAMAAIERGYNLLLEKPVSPLPEECREIERAAHKAGVFVLVCHVLRFTKYFKALKHIIDTGMIGNITNMIHAECVGNLHQSHSFVRGNWNNSRESSFMLLQKSCHDMDILAWLIGKKCTRVQSFGSLTYFKRENAPDGSPEYCIEGCPVYESCPYNAVKLYYDDKSNDWFRRASTRLPDPDDDDVRRAIEGTSYGKCVFKCGNDVVDRQTVNLEFEGGVLASFTMSAFNKGGRYTRIMGTKGEMISSMDSDTVKIYDFDTREEREFNISSDFKDISIVGGHGGGDNGIIEALRDLLSGKTSVSLCDIKESCDNHMIAFAAESSRINGTVVSVPEFSAQFDID